MANYYTRNTAVAKRADRTAYTTYGIAAEKNRRKFHVRNIATVGHMTSLPMAISDTQISVGCFFSPCAVDERYIIHPAANVFWRNE